MNNYISKFLDFLIPSRKVKKKFLDFYRPRNILPLDAPFISNRLPTEKDRGEVGSRWICTSTCSVYVSDGKRNGKYVWEEVKEEDIFKE